MTSDTETNPHSCIEPIIDLLIEACAQAIGAWREAPKHDISDTGLPAAQEPQEVHQQLLTWPLKLCEPNVINFSPVCRHRISPPSSTAPSSTFATLRLAPTFEASATAPVELTKDSPDLSHRVLAIFEDARSEPFEDGMDSRFSESLTRQLHDHGYLAMQDIAHLIRYGRLSSEVACEALKLLGRIDHPRTRPWRLWLLEVSLLSPDPWVRDGAAMGLTSLADPHAIPLLRDAAEKEPIPELREDLRLALQELESACCANAPGHQEAQVG